MDFSFDALPQALADGLAAAFHISEPTEIQSASYGLIHDGRNVVMQSRTGSGKTLAYLLPLLARLTPGEAGNRLLVLAPTQELAVQIANVLRALNAALPVAYSLALLGGGANINHQIDKLKSRPQVLIGTPGRVLELFDRRKINGQTIEAVVFDEVDAISAQENGRLLKLVRKALRQSTQTIAVSASIPDGVQAYLRESLDDPAFLVSSEAAALNPNIGHFVLRCEARKKFDNLRRVLAAMDGKTLIFLNGDEEILHLQDRLAYHHIEVAALSADMKKLDRQKAMHDFRKGVEGILISSDLSARGLDIDDIDQVINMDFPHDPLTYVHRVGRTARGDREGAALSFVSDQDEAAIRIYHRDLGISFTEVHLAGGAVVVGAPEKPDRAEKATKKKSHATKPAQKHQKTRAKQRKSKGQPKRLKRGEH
ncbi:MAG: DEAD/DEAH box helicase [Peptococcaceae bacterium]|nr:DEAD/DEAH box helicase [Peptococcaceae bacterium]